MIADSIRDRAKTRLREKNRPLTLPLYPLMKLHAATLLAEAESGALTIAILGKPSWRVIGRVSRILCRHHLLVAVGLNVRLEIWRTVPGSYFFGY